MDCELDVFGCGIAGKVHAQSLSLSVGEGGAIILIKISFTVRAGKDAQRERAAGPFGSALHERRDRQYGATADKDRQIRKFRVNVDGGHEGGIAASGC